MKALKMNVETKDWILENLHEIISCAILIIVGIMIGVGAYLATESLIAGAWASIAYFGFIGVIYGAFKLGMRLERVANEAKQRRLARENGNLVIDSNSTVVKN